MEYDLSQPFPPRTVFPAMSRIMFAALLLAPAIATAQPLDSAALNGFQWRNIGPAEMSGRVTDVEGLPSPSHTFYVAMATGGIWKTTNAGTSFTPIFDNERVISMGDIAIAPSDTNQIWAGTGEQNVRNSVSPGGGVYKSTNGGASWTRMGLERTEQIGRIVVHPRNPNIVFVAALGHVWNTNPERGLYKTTDGGRTWRLVKFINDSTGFVDVIIDPRAPHIMFAASWQVRRSAFDFASGGKGSALWKSTDGGDTWSEVRGGGFPATTKGRMGLAIAPSDSRVVYASVEADSVRGAAPGAKPSGSLSGLYRSADGGATWTRTSDINSRPFYFSQVTIDTRDPNRVFWSSTPVQYSTDGGVTSRIGSHGVHPDHHAMWMDPTDPQHSIVGNDGGVAQSFDRGGSYNFMNVMALAQFNGISYNMAMPYRLCGGLQDNGTWCGPSRSKAYPLVNSEWTHVVGGDGFFTAQHPTDAGTVYGESQVGGIQRVNPASGVGGRLTRPRMPAGGELRFNWNTPFFLSVHDSTTLYAGANHVLVSKNNANAFAIVSPDLSKKDTAKTNVRFRVGGITTDPGRAETWGTVFALAESPRRAGLLLAGTDDGNLWLSQNAGGNWSDLTSRVSGVPAFAAVSHIELSYADTATFYVTFDNHMANDFTPYVYVTTDFGRTFTSVVNNLPRGSADYVHVIREDPFNRDLLFVGTDLGVYVSRNRGASWQKFMTGMPTVPVTDLQIHPRERELIAATHGRSVWIVGIAPLEQLTPAILAERAHLFAPTPALQYDEKRVIRNFVGNAVYEGTNAPYGAEMVYWSNGGSPADSATVMVTSAKGDTLWQYRGASTRGIHRVYWDFLAGRAAAGDDEDDDSMPDDPTRPAERKGRPVQAIGAGFSTGPTLAPTMATPGEYTITLVLGGQRVQQPLRIMRPDAN